MAPKLRLSFCRNSGKGKGQIVAVAVVAPTFGAVAKAACDKLKISKAKAKSLRLFVFKSVPASLVGHELKQGGVLFGLLSNDTVISVSVGGSDFIYASGNRKCAVDLSADKLTLGDDTVEGIPKPPRFPWPQKKVNPKDGKKVNPKSESHVVPVSSGMLTASGAPSKKRLSDLQDRLGVTHVVTLLGNGKEESRATTVEKFAQELGIGWTHVPLSGAKLDDDDDPASLSKLPGVLELLDGGEIVLLHCAAGMHRTGASAYIIMRLAGMSQDEAVASIKKMREITHDELVMDRKEGQSIQDIAEFFFKSIKTSRDGVTAGRDMLRSEAAGSTPILNMDADYNNVLELHGIFPVFDGCVLPLVREAIANRAEFVERQYDDYIAFDYKDANPGTFLESSASQAKKVKRRERWLAAVRAECRGLLLCAHTGRVLARRFHKFFNINENASAEVSQIPLYSITDLWKCSVTSKLDGSLCSPFLVGSHLKWATRCVENHDISRFCEDQRCDPENTELSPRDYSSLCCYFLERHITPLFEWCEADKTVGVIRHAHDSLVLLAARNIKLGSYISYEELVEVANRHNIPVVAQRSLQDIMDMDVDATSSQSSALENLITCIHQWEGQQEGAVLTLPDQQTKYKIKTSWYVACSQATTSHGASGFKGNVLLEILKKRPSLRDAPPRFIWQTCLAKNSDDSVSFCCSLLNKGGEMAMSLAFLTFYTHVCEYLGHLRKDLAMWGQKVKQTRQVDQAISVASSCGWPTSLLLGFIHAKDSADAMLLKFVLVLVQKNQMEILFHLLGCRWDEATLTCVFNKAVLDHCETSNEAEVSSSAISLSNTVGGQGGEDGDTSGSNDRVVSTTSITVPEDLSDIEFTKATIQLRDHVLASYLPRKIASYLGLSTKALGSNSILHIPRDYKGSEGKLKGSWEMFEKSGIIDLRIDLQPPLARYTDHCGDKEHAMLLVQYGTSNICKRSSKRKKGCEGSGSFAGVLVACGVNFTFSQLQDAMQKSFEQQSFQKLDPVAFAADDSSLHHAGLSSIGSRRKYKVFCDLDGVLADFDRGVQDLLGLNSDELLGKAKGQAQMWRKIVSHGSFFASLEFRDDGRALWDFLNEECRTNDVLQQAPQILTGMPENTKVAKSAKKQKQAWCAAHLGADVGVITCNSHLKHEWGGCDCILIDDLLSHQAGWEAKGGTFVHFTNAHATIRRLRSIFFGAGGYTAEERQGIENVLSSASKIRQQHHQRDGGTHAAAEIFTVAEETIVPVIGSNSAQIDRFEEGVLAADVIALDAEWKPDEFIQSTSPGSKSAAALLQVSTPSGHFVVDLLHIHGRTQNILADVLSDPAILKLGYGFAEDVPRIVAAMPLVASAILRIDPVLDFQGIAGSFLPVRQDKNLLSLAAAANLILGMDMVKDKYLQASDWTSRPLSPEQIRYAACDSAILLAFWETISARSDPLARGMRESLGVSMPFPSQSKLCRFVSSGAATGFTVQALPDDDAITAEALGSTSTVLSLAPPESVDAEFSAFFLTATSRDMLLARFPPRHRKTHACHATIQFAPSPDMVRALPVGRMVRLRVMSIYEDDAGQVAAISFDNPQRDEALVKISPASLHITLSTKYNVPPSYAMELMQFPNSKCVLDAGDSSDLLLDAIVGVAVRLPMSSNALVSMGKDIVKKITSFVEASDPGSKLKFKPGTLTAAERSIIHEFASNNDLESHSEGYGEYRRLVLSVPKRGRKNDLGETDEDLGVRIFSSASEAEDETKRSRKKKQRSNAQNQSERNVVIDPSVSARIQFTCKPVFENDVHGRIMFGDEGSSVDIDWAATSDLNIVYPKLLLENLFNGTLSGTNGILIVMRGLPGSGKSTVASSIKDRCDSVKLSIKIVSADDYWELKTRKSGGGDYRSHFDTEELQQAHDYCRACFELCLGSNGGSPSVDVVIVDNTNMRKAHYAYYERRAMQSGFKVIVVEVKCPTTDVMKLMHGRCTHSVPLSVCAKMFGTMEIDERAVLLLSVDDINVHTQTTDAYLLNASSKDDDIPVSTTDGFSLRSWLSGHHFFHNAASRPKTHLLMDVIGSSKSSSACKFLNISDKFADEFILLYGKECDTNPFFLAEYATRPHFRMCFDIDYTGTSAFDAVAVAKVVSREIDDFFQPSTGSPLSTVVIVGCLPQEVTMTQSEPNEDQTRVYRYGYHFRCPNLVVSTVTALALRKRLVKMLISSNLDNETVGNEISWEEVFDVSIYTHGTLRMVGSRKITKGVDQNRVYNLLSVVSQGRYSDDLSNAYRNDRTRLLRDCSIRARKDEQALPAETRHVL